MEKRLFYWELGGFAVTSALGTALHFAYDWCHWLAPISAVNESTWEHMKLLYVAMLAVSLVQLVFLGKNYPDLPAVRTVSLLTATGLIPALYYTYLGIWGVYRSWVGPAVFFLAAAAGFALDFLLLRKGALAQRWMQVAGIVLWWAGLFLFMWWTFQPPHIPLFQDPVTLGYGTLLQ